MMPAQSKLEDAVTGQLLELASAENEPAFNFRDGLFCPFGHQVHRLDQGRNSEALDRNIGEQYLHQRLSVVFNLCISTAFDGKASDLFIHNEPGTNRNFYASIILDNDSLDEFQFQFRDQEPVLIFHFDGVKTVENRVVASKVRLYDIHNAIDDLFGGFLFESAIDGTFKSIPGLVHRKFGVFGTESSYLKLDLVDRVVESGNEVVSGIPKHQSKIFWKEARPHFEKVISALRVMLYESFVRFSFCEVPGYKVEVIDVLFGPFNL